MILSMFPFSYNREHCLITGIQLLGIYLDCKDNLTKKDKIINLIFNTNGVCPEYKDWSSFLEKKETIQKGKP